jgi:hypothetical protein
MCNLYSVIKGQAAIIEASRAMRDTTGKLAPMPSIFPDYPAPIVRNASDGVRELAMARWGMPCLLSSAALRSRTSATRKVRIGGGGSPRRIAASYRGLAFASTRTLSRKRRPLGSPSMMRGRSRSSQVSGVPGTAFASIDRRSQEADSFGMLRGFLAALIALHSSLLRR